ncbi:glycosyltransferase [uncultured Methanosphaera sp.]|uniref:glycosyltransferase n=1 Tax=uncultured Methanosphaera sp. TaxID=262501 RepID=UPI002592BBBA|nr:glycosyltransferase [uncultured Methanosphaera sp.]
MNPKITLIISITTEKNIEQYLKNIKNQLLENIEVIFVYDKIDKNTNKILENFCKNDSAYLKIISEKNRSHGFLKNKSLNIAQGDFITFIDSTDNIDFNFMEKLYKKAKNEDLDLLISVSYEKIKDYSLSKNMCENVFNFQDMNKSIFYLSNTLKGNLYRRNLLDTYKIRFPTMLSFEDKPFLLETFLTAKHVSILLREPALNMKSEYSSNELLDMIQISTLILNIFKKYDMFNTYKKLLLNFKIYFLKKGYTKIKDKNDYFNLMKEDLINLSQNKKLCDAFLHELNEENLKFYKNCLKSQDFNQFNLNMTFTKINEKLDEKQQKLNFINGNLSKWSEKLNNKENKINNLKTKLDNEKKQMKINEKNQNNREITIQIKEANLKDKETRITQLQENLDNKEKKLDNKIEKYNNLEKELIKKESSINTKFKELETEKELLNEKIKHLEDKENNIIQLQEKLKVQEEKIDQKHVKYIDNLNKITNNLEKNQKEYEKRLIKIDEDITLKKIELEQMQNNNSNKKSNTPKISIIICAYNREEYLKRCLNSVKNQTLKNIEIICADDGSTDNTLDVFRKYANKDHRFKFFTQKNSGPGVARNKAIKMATGEYIMFLDSDDWIELNTCEELYKKVKLNDLDILLFLMKNYSEETGEYYEDSYYNLTPIPDDFENKVFSHEDISNIIFSISISACQKIYKRSLVKKVHFAEKLLFEDNPFFWGVMLQAKRMSLLKKHFYLRSRHTSSITSEYDNKYFDVIPISNKVISIFKELNLVNMYKYQLTNYKINYISQWYHMMEEKYKNTFWDLMHDDFQKLHEDKKIDSLMLNNLNEPNKLFYLRTLKSRSYVELDYLEKYSDEK